MVPNEPTKFRHQSPEVAASFPGPPMKKTTTNLFWILKFAAALIALITLPMNASTQVLAQDEGRVQITFSKPDGSGSGYLFYRGQKYSLSVSGAKIGRMWATSIDLIGTASNLRGAAEILCVYNAT